MFRTNVTFESITRSLQNTLQQLDRLKVEKNAEAETKSVRANELMNEALADREEAVRAARVATKIEELLS